MPWDAKFWRPIVLKDGRKVTTLSEARVLILSLPNLHQSDPHWQYTAEMLLLASGSKSAIDQAQTHLLRALKAEGLI
jgi:hypothetical protein